VVLAYTIPISLSCFESGSRKPVANMDTRIGVKRLFAEYTRETKDEKLEVAAKRLVKELSMILKRTTRG